jgi:hypothetical protein
MMSAIGLVILSAYGVVTAIGGVAALRQGHKLGISRIQAGVFGLLGVAIAVVALASRGHALIWIACLASLSLLSRVWNGTKMGGVRASHIVLFGSVLALGTVLAFK